MAEKFNDSQHLAAEQAIGGEHGKIIKAEASLAREVSGFSFTKLNSTEPSDYSALKSKFGPLAKTDPDYRRDPRFQSRFNLSPLQRERLQIEAEERRAIEAEVESKLGERAEKVLQDARAQGMAEGFEAGKKEAQAQLTQATAEKIDRISSLLSEFETCRKQILEAQERSLVDLVFRIGRMLFLKELSADRGYVTRLLHSIVERLGAKENVRIRLNPKDLEIVEEVRKGVVEGLGIHQNLQIELSPQVRGGGIQVETRWNAIDASINTQIESVYQALFGESGGDAGGSAESGSAPAEAETKPAEAPKTEGGDR